MDKFETKLLIEKSFFNQKEKTLLKNDKFVVNAFNYDSGVNAVKIINNKGYIIALPFKGQQIWEAFFLGRNLTMKSNFVQPRNVRDFIHSYGAFIYHCGASRVGCPSEKDSHSLHGELPYADYDKAQIIIGENENGRYVGISGLFEYNVAFSYFYHFIPRVLLYENSSVLSVEVEIRNLSNYPMELMYMVHINFRLIDNGIIMQPCSWNSIDMNLRSDLSDDVQLSEEYDHIIDKLSKDLKLSKIIKPEDRYDPEVVFFLDNMNSDKNGITYFIYVHPDGTADYISFNINELDHATRWVVKNRDQEALGLALPATCDAEGYIKEKKKGNIKFIEPRSEFKTKYSIGALDSEEKNKIIKNFNFK